MLWSSLGNVKSFSVVFGLSSLVLLWFLFSCVCFLLLTASRASNFKNEARRKLRADSPAHGNVQKRVCSSTRPKELLCVRSSFLERVLVDPPPLFTWSAPKCMKYLRRIETRKWGVIHVLLKAARAKSLTKTLDLQLTSHRGKLGFKDDKESENPSIPL